MAKKQNAKKVEEVLEEKVIVELELIAVETTRLHVTKLGKEKRKAEAVLEQLEANVIRRLKEGAIIQGSKTAVIEEGLGQFSPKWKEMYIGHMANHGVSEAMCEEASRKAYPQKPVEKLVIGDKSPTME